VPHPSNSLDYLSTNAKSLSVRKVNSEVTLIATIWYMEKKNHATVYLSEFFSTRQKLLIWRVTVDLRVGHSIYELTFHPRIAR
jgi:hypothetical protein